MYDDLGYELTYQENAGSVESGISEISARRRVVRAARGPVDHVPVAAELRPAAEAARPGRVAGSGWHRRLKLVLIAINVIAAVVVAVGLITVALTMFSVMDVWQGLPATAQPEVAPGRIKARHSCSFSHSCSCPCSVMIAVLFLPEAQLRAGVS